MARRRKGDEAMSFEQAWGLVKEMDGHEDSTGGPIDLEEMFEMFIMDSGHNAMTMEEAVEAVRNFVEYGNEVMPSVKIVADRLNIKGKDLMRAYTEAYR